MLMLYELEVLQSESERIGEPVALPLTDIINGGGNNARLGKWMKISRPWLQREGLLFLETNQDHQAPAPAAGTSAPTKWTQTTESAFV